MALFVRGETLAGASKKLRLLLEVGGEGRVGDQRLLNSADDRRVKPALLVNFGFHLVEEVSPASHPGVGLQEVFGSRAPNAPYVGEKPIEHGPFPARAAAGAKIQRRGGREGYEI